MNAPPSFRETPARSLTKTVSWRCCAILNSFIVLTWSTTSRPIVNAVAMNITGFFVFYLFERIWNRIQWGRISGSMTARKKETTTNTRMSIDHGES